MKNIFRGIIAVLLVAAGLFVANGVAQADSYDDIQKYTAQITQNPCDYEAYYNRGISYYNLGQYEQAIQDYNKAIQLNPNDFLLYVLRGYCYKQLGDEAKAQADFAKANELGYND